MNEILRPAVFLDRDGTIIEEVNYLTQPEQLRLIPGAAAAIRQVNAYNIPVIVVTNQSGVARGLLTETELSALHDSLRNLLAEEGAYIDAIYYCPHHPEGIGSYRRNCDCRKPAPGMLKQAASELHLDLTKSVMIGDSLRDLQAGLAAGCGTLFLVQTGYGAEEILPAEVPAKVHANLAGAIRDFLA